VKRLLLLSFVCLTAWLVSGCSTLGFGRDIDGNVPLNKAIAEVPENQLLDVWVELFDPGMLPEDEDDAMGLSMDIREAESRYMPEQLRTVMEATGYWGAVRVVPQNTEGAELLVRGTIIESDGQQLELEITALDATGREWFNRNYEEEIEADAYRRNESRDADVFHSLYHAIANDLAAFRQKLTAKDIVAIHQVAELRFAADLAPDTFSDYLSLDSKGRYSVTRLPAAGEPMFRRVLAIRDRDFLLIDTLNGHFDNFVREMDIPYTEWRKARSEEAEALNKVENDALKRKLIGAAAIIGAVVLESSNNGNYGTSVLRDSLILGGAYAIKSGFDRGAETDIHRDTIIELDESFSSEAKPLVVEVEGEVHELTGSAEVQYAQWRALLKRIYASETGFAGY
jgi:predicted small secreted protein